MLRYIYTLYTLLNLCLCTFATDKVDAVFTLEKGLYSSTRIYNANYAVGNVALDALNDTNWQLYGFKVSTTVNDGERILLIVESSLHSESYL